MSAPEWLKPVLAVYFAMVVMYSWYLTDRPRKPRTIMENLEATAFGALTIWVLLS